MKQQQSLFSATSTITLLSDNPLDVIKSTLQKEVRRSRTNNALRAAFDLLLSGYEEKPKC